MAFLHLLQAEAPQALSAVAELLLEEGAEELFNEDYAGYEERMESIGLKDYGRAAEVLDLGPMVDDDPVPASTGVAATATAFLARVLTELIAHRGCTEATIEGLGAQLLEVSNDLAMADGAGSDEGAARAARATADRLVAAGLLRRSQGDVEHAVAILLSTSVRDLLRDGRRGQGT